MEEKEERKKPIIVTRHKGLIEWLEARNIRGDVIEHVDSIDQIQWRDVIGNLPLGLASEANVVLTVLIPDCPVEKRGQDLTAEEMDQYGAVLKAFAVYEVVQKTTMGLKNNKNIEF